MTGRMSRRLLLAIAVLGLTLAAVLTSVAHAGAAVRYKLSLADQGPPGGTSAFELAVEARKASCSTAKLVMKSFHRCRTESRVGCATKVRCTGARR